MAWGHFSRVIWLSMAMANRQMLSPALFRFPNTSTSLYRCQDPGCLLSSASTSSSGKWEERKSHLAWRASLHNWRYVMDGSFLSLGLCSLQHKDDYKRITSCEPLGKRWGISPSETLAGPLLFLGIDCALHSLVWKKIWLLSRSFLICNPSHFIYKEASFLNEM